MDNNLVNLFIQLINAKTFVANALDAFRAPELAYAAA